jgi:hypothetical protein
MSRLLKFNPLSTYTFANMYVPLRNSSVGSSLSRVAAAKKWRRTPQEPPDFLQITRFRSIAMRAFLRVVQVLLLLFRAVDTLSQI